jgi:two-component system phosphate regulon sensor histidine kinase PhoR
VKKHIFKRIFVIYCVVLLLSVVFIELYITSIVRDSYLTSLKNSLFIQANLISDNIAVDTGKTFDDLSRQLKEVTNARITIIDSDGKAVGDSDRSSSSMDNHADRPEIKQANLEGTGWSVRHSNTVKDDLLYIAKRIIRNEKLEGFIRLAVPLADIDRSINSLRLKINLVVILLFLISGLVLIRQTDRIRKYVNQIKDYSGALALGLFKKKLYIENAGEFSELAHNLNDMALDLEKNVNKINEETNRLNVILRSIPDAMLLINTEGIIELSNKAAQELLGNPQLEKLPFIEAIRNADFSSLIDRVKRSYTASSTEVTLDAPVEKYLLVNVSPLFYKAGELAGIVAIFHDTTQLKKLEQVRKDFVANVSHEMKTPVTAIKGFAETLLDGALYDKYNAERFLETIKSNSERLNKLVEDLLTISQVELGVIRINKTDLDIPEVIDAVTGTFVVQAAEKDIRLTKSLDPDADVIKADSTRVEQILLNLVDNSIKFSESGEITIGTGREDGSSYLFVRDTGKGIPQKYLPRLGERFFRVDPSRSRELGGTGLGLAIVKHLVMAHGWTMKIESEPGKGTVVRIFYS